MMIIIKISRENMVTESPMYPRLPSRIRKNTEKTNGRIMNENLLKNLAIVLKIIRTEVKMTNEVYHPDEEKDQEQILMFQDTLKKTIHKHHQF